MSRLISGVGGIEEDEDDGGSEYEKELISDSREASLNNPDTGLESRIQPKPALLCITLVRKRGSQLNITGDML